MVCSKSDTRWVSITKLKRKKYTSIGLVYYGGRSTTWLRQIIAEHQQVRRGYNHLNGGVKVSTGSVLVGKQVGGVQPENGQKQ